MVWLWNAFQWLSSRRSYHMNGPNPISPESIKAYCDLKGIKRDDDVDLLLHTVDVLDNVWMEDWVRREKQRTEKSSSKPSKRF